MVLEHVRCSPIPESSYLFDARPLGWPATSLHRTERACRPFDLKLRKSLKVLDGQLDSKRAATAAPPIAFDVSDKPLAITVDLDKVFPAAVALHLATLLNHSSLLPKRDQLAWSTLHRFLVCAARYRVVAH